jgi:hypothetical protein
MGEISCGHRPGVLIGVPFVTSVIVVPRPRPYDDRRGPIAATQPKRLYASTAREVFTSNNLGETWQPLGIREKWPLPYARGIMVKADDLGVLFAGCGDRVWRDHDE